MGNAEGDMASQLSCFLLELGVSSEMIKAPYTIFGKTRYIPVATYTDGKIDTPPKPTWDREMWMEREEDWYGLPQKGTIRVVEREVWLSAGEEQ